MGDDHRAAAPRPPLPLVLRADGDEEMGDDHRAAAPRPPPTLVQQSNQLFPKAFHF